MNIYKDMLTERDVMVSVRNQMLTKYVDVKLNLRLMSKTDPKNIKDDKQRAEFEKNLAITKGDLERLAKIVSSVDDEIKAWDEAEANKELKA